jgi:hypothetical protein
MKPTGTGMDVYQKRSIRSRIAMMEEAMSKSDGQRDFSEGLVEHWADNVYARELWMPAGAIITSKIHKMNHFVFVMYGKSEVIDENAGGVIIEGPCMIKTLAGTKRILRIIEDTLWIGVYPTLKTNSEDIEKDIISPVHLDLLEHDGD